MIIIGVDTGLYTGMAYWDTKIMEKPNAIEVPYIETGDTLFKWLHSVNARQDVAVACERFVILPGSRLKTAQPEALMGMGAVEYICRAAGRRVVWQFPVDAKRLVPDSLLRQIGWYVQTKDGHANDGMRHLLKWYADNYPAAFAELAGI